MFLYLRGNIFYDACNFKRDSSDADFSLVAEVFTNSCLDRYNYKMVASTYCTIQQHTTQKNISKILVPRLILVGHVMCGSFLDFLLGFCLGFVVMLLRDFLK